MSNEADVSAHRRAARGGGRRGPRHIAIAVLTVVVAISAVAVALASGSPATLGSTSSRMLGTKVVTGAKGRTVYTLSPETTRHLLCKSAECLRNWPPVTVSSSRTKPTAAAGVQGRLGIVRRGHGVFQVTLRGKPLYRYAHDHAKGEASGQGIESFGGTWHAVTASSGGGSSGGGTTTMSQPTPPTTSTMTTPSYPAY